MPITTSRSAGYSTGALAKRAGVHLENIRYFEKIGLIPKPDRAANGTGNSRHCSRNNDQCCQHAAKYSKSLMQFDAF